MWANWYHMNDEFKNPKLDKLEELASRGNRLLRIDSLMDFWDFAEWRANRGYKKASNKLERKIASMVGKNWIEVTKALNEDKAFDILRVKGRLGRWLDHTVCINTYINEDGEVANKDLTYSWGYGDIKRGDIDEQYYVHPVTNVLRESKDLVSRKKKVNFREQTVIDIDGIHKIEKFNGIWYHTKYVCVPGMRTPRYGWRELATTIMGYHDSRDEYFLESKKQLSSKELKEHKLNND